MAGGRMSDLPHKKRKLLWHGVVGEIMLAPTFRVIRSNADDDHPRVIIERYAGLSALGELRWDPVKITSSDVVHVLTAAVVDLHKFTVPAIDPDRHYPVTDDEDFGENLKNAPNMGRLYSPKGAPGILYECLRLPEWFKVGAELTHNGSASTYIVKKINENHWISSRNGIEEKWLLDIGWEGEERWKLQKDASYES
ncbi:hypothetical protein LCGC14_0469470 [marine sediment metagenome]|uniref:Uncharacterized protein n=1 Tax=marine sediment metagenome TaxID=412755 RepID=A0A0F9SVC7_9ZZZZ